MDLHLLAILLICLCREGQTQSDALDLSTPTLKSGSTNATSTNGASDGVSDEEMEGDCQELGRSPKSQEALAKAILRLGMQVLENLKTTHKQPNVIISPLSITLALSQLALGAANETKELLMQHLHKNIVPCYHQSLHNLLLQLKDDDLQVATRILLQRGFQAKPKFTWESMQIYDSEPVALEGVKEVNEWVKKATNGHMTDFLTSLPPNLVLMLINAVHFKGEWKNRFDSRYTSRQVFYVDENHIVDVDMMESVKYPLSLLIDNDLDAQVARFRFKKQMSLLLVVPLSGKVDVSALGAKLNISDLYDRLSKTKAMQVRIPKFNLEYSQDLKTTLTTMGLGELFAGPNLAGIAEGSLLVSSVQHKSSFEINEEGAEAAAATSVGLSRSNPSFTLNQPFFFGLMDDQTQAPVFLGVITNPSPKAPILEYGGYGSKDKVEFADGKNSAGRSYDPK